jgi:hypothetical protein
MLDLLEMTQSPGTWRPSGRVINNSHVAPGEAMKIQIFALQGANSVKD